MERYAPSDRIRIPVRVKIWVVAGLAWTVAGMASGQESRVVQWAVDDGEGRRVLEARPGWRVDDVPAASRDLLADYHRQGRWLARVDSAVTIDGPGVRTIVLFASPGPALRVAEVRIVGASAFPEAEWHALMRTRAGRRFDEREVERDIQAILQAYIVRGYLLATVALTELAVVDREGEPGLWVGLSVDEGEPIRLATFELAGASRTQPAFVERLLGVRTGALLARDLDEVQLRLEETALFTRVERPVLFRTETGEVGMRVVVEEAPPGAFDLVLGYQPSSGGATSAGVVGSGHLALRNLFGTGRSLGLRLHRLPGQISRLEASYRDPFLAGLPVQIELAFDGLQQDSTYAQQVYDGAIGYRLAAGFDVLLTLRREATRPGLAGVALMDGRQRVARASALFAGGIVRYRRLDRVDAPRRGIVLEAGFERGTKERTTRSVSPDGDTLATRLFGRLERLRLEGRAYLPTSRRLVAVIGDEATAVIGESLDESDLIRFGGATSLRGYDEDRFRGQFVNRGFVEYRYLIERASYAFLFFDLGYVDQPAAPSQPRSRALFTGYGFGLQFETGVGVINTSFALAGGDAPGEARVHVGLSFGL
jgi:outer membrane protein assembly factor BamA